MYKVKNIYTVLLLNKGGVWVGGSVSWGESIMQRPKYLASDGANAAAN